MKLWRDGVELQDACKLADAQVENDGVLALAFRLAGETESVAKPFSCVNAPACSELSNLLHGACLLGKFLFALGVQTQTDMRRWPSPPLTRQQARLLEQHWFRYNKSAGRCWFAVVGS